MATASDISQSNVSAAKMLFGMLTEERPWGKELMRKDIRKNGLQAGG